jgi:hypothetical protein
MMRRNRSGAIREPPEVAQNRTGATREPPEAAQPPEPEPEPPLFIDKQSLTSDLRRLAGNREVRVGLPTDGPNKQAAFTLALVLQSMGMSTFTDLALVNLSAYIRGAAELKSIKDHSDATGMLRWPTLARMFNIDIDILEPGQTTKSFASGSKGVKRVVILFWKKKKTYYATSSGTPLVPFKLSSEADVASASLRFLSVRKVIFDRDDIAGEANSTTSVDLTESEEEEDELPSEGKQQETLKKVDRVPKTLKPVQNKNPMTRPYPILSDVTVAAFLQLNAAKDSLRGFQLNPQNFIGSELTKRIAPWWQSSLNESFDKGCEREVEDFFEKLDIVIRDMSGTTRKGQGYLYLALNSAGQLDRDCISTFDDDCRNTLSATPGSLDDKERRLLQAVQQSDPSLGLYIGNSLSIAKGQSRGTWTIDDSILKVISSLKEYVSIREVDARRLSQSSQQHWQAPTFSPQPAYRPYFQQGISPSGQVHYGPPVQAQYVPGPVGGQMQYPPGYTEFMQQYAGVAPPPPPKRLRPCKHCQGDHFDSQCPTKLAEANAAANRGGGGGAPKGVSFGDTPSDPAKRPPTPPPAGKAEDEKTPDKKRSRK